MYRTYFVCWVGRFFIFTNLTMQIKEFWILCRGSEPAPLDLRRWVSHTNILFPQRSLWDLFRENIPPQKLLLEFSECHYQKKKQKKNKMVCNDINPITKVGQQTIGYFWTCILTYSCFTEILNLLHLNHYNFFFGSFDIQLNNNPTITHN